MTMRALSVLAVSMVLLGGCESEVEPGTDGGRVEDGGTTTDAGGGGSGGRSAGCGMNSTLEEETFVSQSLSVGGSDRTYFVHLPAGYDPSRAYPIVYQLHGCSDSATREDNNVPVQRESGGDAIHVRGRAAANCWDTATDGPDVPYFDAMVAAVEGALCVDTSHRFLAGYSSGSFMTHRLACIRGDMLRGVASIAGGQSGRDCTGNVAALLIHDRNDGTVNISASEGTRDDHAMRNGCDLEAARTPTEAPCEAYVGCDADLPVVWCETSGMNHSRQDGLAAPIFWSFFESL
jgi:poly(3-hydroxybutyrate) depolymerase